MAPWRSERRYPGAPELLSSRIRALRFVLGPLNNGVVLLEICCLRANNSSWTVTLSIPVITVSSLLTISLSPRRTPMTVAVAPQPRAQLAQGSVTGYKDVSTDSGWALMSAVAQQHVPIAIEAGQSSTTTWAVWKLMRIQQSWGGNSPLDCVFFGRVAGAACARYVLGDRAKATSLAALAGGGNVWGVEQ